MACRCHGEGCETAGVALPLPKVESPNGEGHLKVMQANEPAQVNRESPSGERCQWVVSKRGEVSNKGP